MNLAMRSLFWVLLLTVASGCKDNDNHQDAENDTDTDTNISVTPHTTDPVPDRKDLDTGLDYEVLLYIKTPTLKGFGVLESGIYWCDEAGKMFFVPKDADEPILLAEVAEKANGKLSCMFRTGFLFYQHDDEGILWRVPLPLDLDAPPQGDTAPDADTETDTDAAPDADTETDTDAAPDTDTETDTDAEIAPGTGEYIIQHVALPRTAMFRDYTWGPFIVEDPYVYIGRPTSTTQKQLTRATIGTMEEEILVDDLLLVGMTLHGDDLYYADSGNYVWRIPKGGGTPEKELYVWNGPEDFLIHGDTLYASTAYNGVHKHTLGTDINDSTRISNLSNAGFSQVDNGKLYMWSDYHLHWMDLDKDLENANPGSQFVGGRFPEVTRYLYFDGAIYTLVQQWGFGIDYNYELWRIPLNP
ncbi:MAG: hypothetical protein M0R76_07560 [Proteobacteria bacterium]|nr:hypothetical protein [Pseudomonadota bacterium]